MDHRSAQLRGLYAQVAPERVADLVPRRLGPWLLNGVISGGATTTVYLARPADAGEQSAQYAVKVLKAEWQDQPLVLSLFRREAAVGRRVTHPHLVSILSAQVAAPPYYLVMPLLAGRTIEERLQAGERFLLPHALWIARQSAEALDALHCSGYLHGDVKPANLMLSRAGHVTLLDLGFTREVVETGSALDRPVLGTINYLAPELLTSTTRADERSDLYSLGATLYEMLTGQPLYVARSLEELAEQQQRGAPRDVRAVDPQVPAAVAELIRSLLAREPFRRPRRAAEVIARLITLEIGTLHERIPA